MSTLVLSEISWRERFKRTALAGMAVLGEMPFLEHLEELRRRMIKSLIGLAAGTLAGFAYTAAIIEFLKRPAADARVQVVAIDATEIFILSRIGLVSAGFLMRNFKYAFLLFSIAAAVLTPSTQFAPMLFFMGVMTGIYLVSIGVALIFGRARSGETA